MIKTNFIKFGKLVWNKIDGWKSIYGLILLVLGCGAYWFKFFNPIAPYFVGAGLSLLGIGLPHKASKM